MNDSNIDVSIANSALVDARSAFADFVSTHSNDIVATLCVVLPLLFIFLARGLIRRALRSFLLS